MTIDEGLFQLLTTTPAVMAFIGTSMSPVLLPDNPPATALTYQIISNVPQYTMDGPVGLSRMRVQFDIWADNYGNARGATEAIRALLDGFSGQLPNETVVYNTLRDNVTTTYEKYARKYRVQTDWVFLFAEQ